MILRKAPPAIRKLKLGLFKRWKEQNDEWGNSVLACLLLCREGRCGVEVVYHNICMTNFRLKNPETSKKKGRPVDVTIQHLYERIGLEDKADGELYTIKDFLVKMKEFNDNQDVNFFRKNNKKETKGTFWGPYLFSSQNFQEDQT